MFELYSDKLQMSTLIIIFLKFELRMPIMSKGHLLTLAFTMAYK